MPSINNISIKPKLISLFLLVGLVPLAIVGWFSIQKSEQTLEAASFNQLEAVRDIKKAQMNDYFHGIINSIDALEIIVKNIQTESYNKLNAVSSLKKSQLEMYFHFREVDIKSLAHNSFAIDALSQFSQAFDQNSANPTDNDAWEKVHQDFDKWFKDYIKLYGYYDIFLISSNGNVVYTEAKKSDLGENLLKGKLQNSALAKAFKKALKSDYAIADFEPYAPSNGDQAAFIATPIISNGFTFGVIALQLPTDKINAIVQNHDGMGIDRYYQSGESMGKAGGYAIQGKAAQFIRKISGSYSAIMGLPLYETSQLINKFDTSF